MSERDKLMRAAERFLKLVPVQTRERGRSYHATGHVLKLTCVNPDQAYTAIVRGSQDYTVTLTYSERTWASDCSCPMGYDCKHAVAAMLELQRAVGRRVPGHARCGVGHRQERQRRRSYARRRANRFRSRRPHRFTSGWWSNSAARWTTPKPASFERCRTSTPMSAIANLRKATSTRCFPSISVMAGRASICGRRNPRTTTSSGSTWPRNCVAGRFPCPATWRPITDFGTLEAAIKKWEREKEVAHWQAWFESNETSVPPAAETLDLRLAFLAEEARLQWRTQPDAPFADLKQAQAKRFGENVEHGTLTLTPDAMLLWGALHKPWSYESWWSLRYNSEASCLPLNRLLRLPLPPERFVNANGEPLARPAEPLRLQLIPPAGGRRGLRTSPHHRRRSGAAAHSFRPERTPHAIHHRNGDLRRPAQERPRT